MVAKGDRVLLVVGGKSVFEVVELVEEDGGRALVQAIADVPGRYPFSARIADLVPAPAD